MTESLGYSEIVSSQHMAELAKHLIRSLRESQDQISIRLGKLLKRVSGDDIMRIGVLKDMVAILEKPELVNYLYFLFQVLFNRQDYSKCNILVLFFHRVHDLIHVTCHLVCEYAIQRFKQNSNLTLMIAIPSRLGLGISSQGSVSVWTVLAASLTTHISKCGGDLLNEGTRIDPNFDTTHTLVTSLFWLLSEDSDVKQVFILGLEPGRVRIFFLDLRNLLWKSETNTPDLIGWQPEWRYRWISGWSCWVPPPTAT